MPQKVRTMLRSFIFVIHPFRVVDYLSLLLSLAECSFNIAASLAVLEEEYAHPICLRDFHSRGFRCGATLKPGI
jgi:hypothetical protein